MTPPDPLERQIGLAAGNLRFLATMLREYGYPDKADEADHAARICDDWAWDYRKEKEAVTE